jgi:MSHA pilin protein MshC
MNILTPSLKMYGVTLVELVTTLLIIGILSAIAGPRFFDESDFQERAYIDELASSMRLAQRLALASNCEVRFVIDGAGYVATQSSFAACGALTGPWSTQVLRADGSPLSGKAPSSVSATPAATLVFTASGELMAPAPTFIVGPFTVSVDQFSGNITVTP